MHATSTARGDSLEENSGGLTLAFGEMHHCKTWPQNSYAPD